MLTHCHHWELERSFPPAAELSIRLKEMAHTEALLVLAKTSFPPDWNLDYFHILVDGPSRFIRLYLTTPPAPTVLAPLRDEHQSWLGSFSSLRQASLAGTDWREEAALLTGRILSQLQHEEEKIYPCLDEFLACQRPIREMLYEHQGIRRFLPELIDALEATENNKRWERFSLDLIHLLEHHIEHEERGLYPVYERLPKEGMGTQGVQ